MTREEHLKSCKKCVNRKLDMNIGLVCNLTGRIADFESECTSFQRDETVVEEIEGAQPIPHSDVLGSLSERDLEKFRFEQNYSSALVAGLVVGVLGAILWGIITVATEYQIGYMAIAVGAGVGLSMRYLGKGIDLVFGITGGIIALVSCLLGNFFSIIGFLANSEGLGYLEALLLFDYTQLIPIMTEIFSPIDLLFYAIAAYQGYKLSFRTFTEEELSELKK